MEQDKCEKIKPDCARCRYKKTEGKMELVGTDNMLNAFFVGY